MTNGKKVMVGCAVFAMIGFLFCGVMTLAGVSTYNKVMRIENLIKAKQKDNESEFDNMFKKISQVAQVTQKERDSLKDLFVGHAEARTGEGGGKNAMMNWIKESIPTVDNSMYKNLSNVITGSRDSWTMRQKEILDMKRQHDDYRTTAPSSLICMMFGIEEIKVQIITSGRAKEAMRTGEDNDTSVF